MTRPLTCVRKVSLLLVVYRQITLSCALDVSSLRRRGRHPSTPATRRGSCSPALACTLISRYALLSVKARPGGSQLDHVPLDKTDWQDKR